MPRNLKLFIVAASLAVLFLCAPAAEASVKGSMVKLENLGKKTADSDVDKKLLNAAGIIDGMSPAKQWQEFKKLLNLKEFTYSKYYDELLYVYMAHLANGKDRREMDYLWEKMREMKDSIHLFPAMLIRLFSQKDTSYYKAELTRTYEFIRITPPDTKVHGPMFEGNFLFGYTVREDFSTGPLPKVYRLKEYLASPKPLEGFSDDTQYIGLLEQYMKHNAFGPELAITLAELYEKGAQNSNASSMHHKLATYYNNLGSYPTASKHIEKALSLSPTNQSIKELKKQIDLSLVLTSEGEVPEVPSATPAVQQTSSGSSCDNSTLFNHGKALSKSRLKNKSKSQLRLIRNEIFASHGRPFRSQDLHDYFTAKCWYKVDMDYSDKVLTATDRDNILTIRSVEESK